jgi:hypothetical protein
MCWWDWLGVAISSLLFMVGFTVLLMGHAWPTKQEWNETSSYHQTFQHDESELITNLNIS